MADLYLTYPANNALITVGWFLYGTKKRGKYLAGTRALMELIRETDPKGVVFIIATPKWWEKLHA
jgi:hypothetical protein